MYCQPMSLDRLGMEYVMCDKLLVTGDCVDEVWWVGQELNLHELALTASSRPRVYQFRHLPNMQY